MLAVAIGMGFFASCSSDDDNGSETQNPVLVRKITETVYYSATESDTYVTDFVYDGNVLKRMVSGNSYTALVMSDDQIAFLKKYTNDIQTGQTGFVYNDGKLTQMNGQNQERTNFTYNQNALATIQNQYFDEDVWVTNNTETYVFNSQPNLTQETIIGDLGGGITSNFRNTFTYDSKNNPFRDMNPYLRLISGFEGFDPKSRNNIFTRTMYNPSTDTTPVGTQNYTIVYNASDFPVSIEKRSDSGSLISTTLFEYQQAQ